jgi:hypothetical protein
LSIRVRSSGHKLTDAIAIVGVLFGLDRAGHLRPNVPRYIGFRIANNPAEKTIHHHDERALSKCKFIGLPFLARWSVKAREIGRDT